eukprot:69312-Rhodomonas_salina.3
MVRSAISLRTCSAMSSNEITCGATCLRACYAMSGTEIAHGAISLCACYAMSAVLTQRTVLAGIATFGTDVAYGATRHRNFQRTFPL